jgi:hypothetical protein
MRMSWDAVGALVLCLVVGRLPLRPRAEGLRIGFFGALMGYVFFDVLRSARRNIEGDDEFDDLDEEAPRAIVAPPPDLTLVDEDARISGGDLLTDFSILRHLRRLGAVSDSEFEQKKVDILRRV